MEYAIGSNYRKDQSFVQALVHEDPTIENDDSKEADSEEANSEDNDSHNIDDSYSTDQGNFNIDSVADVYENVGFANNPVERDEIDDDVGFGQKQNPVEAEVGVGHTIVDPTSNCFYGKV